MSLYITNISATYDGEDSAFINLSFDNDEENQTLILFIGCDDNYVSRTVEIDIDSLIWTLKQIKATSAKIREMEENYNPDLES